MQKQRLLSFHGSIILILGFVFSACSHTSTLPDPDTASGADVHSGVKQNIPLRVLDEPVIVERDDIMLIVTRALLSPAETLIEFQFETTSDLRRTCDGKESMDRLHLPDGVVLLPMMGGGGGGGGGSVSVHTLSHVFTPIPADVHQATLIIPCLLETGEDWEIPLTFVPLPPDQTMVPIPYETIHFPIFSL